MKDGDSRTATENAVFSLLENGLRILGTEEVAGSIQKLTDLVMILEEWSSRINLTGHQGPVDMATRLVLDAAAMATALPELRAAASLADLGSGAGFPGLPLAILNPHLQVYLVDSRLKRHHFRREARRRLHLERVVSVLGRSDEVESEACDIVVAQAMTTPRDALRLMAQWAHPRSILVLPASENAIPPECPPGIGSLELREYQVPNTGTRRKLWLTRPEPD